MRYVTSYVGEAISTKEVEQLRSRTDSLGWVMQTQPAGPGQVRIVSITAPAAPEDEPTQAINEELSSLSPAAPATSGGLPRRDRVLIADHGQPALAIAG